MKALSMIILSVVTFLPAVVRAQSDATCKPEQAALNSIGAKYKPEYAAIEQRGAELGKKQPDEGDKVKFNVKVDMREQKWILKLPSVTMERNDIVMGLPEVKMNLRTLSYDLPEVRMERRKTGQIPQTTCSQDDWGIPYDCRTTWTNTYADVPVTTMVRHELKTDIPEVKWSDQKLSWDVPKLTWVENVWIVKIPEFTVINVAVEQGKDLRAQSEGLREEVARVNANRISDSLGATKAMYACFRSDMEAKQVAMEKEMEAGISSLTSSVESIRSQGADPTKVPSGSGKAIDLVATLADMLAKRKQAADSFVAAREVLDEAEKVGVSKLQ